MGPYAGVDYNLTFCPLQSPLQNIYHGQPYARVDLNPMPESTLTPPPSGTFELTSEFVSTYLCFTRTRRQDHMTYVEQRQAYIDYEA
jgi:hypothetical protein